MNILNRVKLVALERTVKELKKEGWAGCIIRGYRRSMIETMKRKYTSKQIDKLVKKIAEEEIVKECKKYEKQK